MSVKDISTENLHKGGVIDQTKKKKAILLHSLELALDDVWIFINSGQGIYDGLPVCDDAIG